MARSRSHPLTQSAKNLFHWWVHSASQPEGLDGRNAYVRAFRVNVHSFLRRSRGILVKCLRCHTASPTSDEDQVRRDLRAWKLDLNGVSYGWPWGVLEEESIRRRLAWCLAKLGAVTEWEDWWGRGSSGIVECLVNCLDGDDCIRQDRLDSGESRLFLAFFLAWF